MKRFKKTVQPGTRGRQGASPGIIRSIDEIIRDKTQSGEISADTGEKGDTDGISFIFRWRIII
jgi:hypothetical protein